MLGGGSGTAPYTLSTGTQYQVLNQGASAATWDAVHLDQAAAVTGILPITFGGTGSNNGSITGSGALAFVAGGTNQNVSITPSGTGFTLLSGNVGIGTTTPSARLHIIRNTGESTPMKINNTDTTSGFITLQANGTTCHNISFINPNSAIYNMYTGGVLTNSFSTVGNSYFNGGNLGVGTTSPLRLLHISGSGAGNSDILITDTSQGTDLKNFEISNRSQVLEIGTQNDAGNNFGPIITFTRGGSVGIGTTSPNTTLAITSPGYGAISLANTNADTTQKGAVITGSRYTNANIPFTGFGTYDDNSSRTVYLGGGGWTRPDANYISFYTAPTYTETNNTGVQRMIINGAGNVGIGNTSPSNLLQLGTDATTAGTLGISNGTAGGATITVQNLGATSAYAFNLPTTAGSSGQVLTSQGGGSTSMTWSSPFINPMTTKGDLVYENATPAPARLPIGSTGNVLTVSGGVPTWAAPAAPTYTAPTVQVLTYASGSRNGGFVNGSPTISSVASFTSIYNGVGLIGTGIPNNTYVLSFNSGAGTITMSQNFTGSTGTVSFQPTSVLVGGVTTPTYTLPTNPTPLYLRVKMVGGGGGGGNSGTSGGTAGTSGGNATFGSSFLTANGGGAGGNSAPGGTGGTASIVGALGQAFTGGVGGAGSYNGGTTTAVQIAGGMGAPTPFGGGAGGGRGTGSSGTAGDNGAANTGAGGGGASIGSTNASSGLFSGSGGGAGGYLEAIVTSPSATYTFSVPTGGTGQAAAGSGSAGGNGGSGIIIVEEFYQ
jgi:hypothetical protein